MAILKLPARVRTFNECSLSVPKLTNLVVSPEQKGAEVEASDAVAPAALDA